MKKEVINHCIKCDHSWKQRRGTRKPKVCPSCKNPNWSIKNNKEIVKLIVGDFWERQS